MSNKLTANAVPDDLAPFLALLDAVDENPGAVRLRARSYELLGLTAGSRLLDAGCGGGRAAAEAARLGARAFGVDPDERTIAIARGRWSDVEFRVADARSLPYPDASMDAYRAEKMYHELADPRVALNEARRVLVPGGRVALIGQDWDTIVIDAADAELTRAIVRAGADQVPAPRAARCYRSLLLDAGFRDVEVEVRTGIFTDGTILPVLSGMADSARAAGAITRSEADGWIADQRERATAGRTFVAIPMFTATATRL